MCCRGSLVLHLFYVPLRISHSYQDVVVASDGLENLGIYSTPYDL
jgi:hypothetical protein